MEKKILAIQNKSEYDEPPAKPFELPALSEDVPVGFFASDDLSVIEDGIRAIERTTGMMRIVQGLAILKAESLWQQSDQPTLWAYRKAANIRYGISRASISNLRKVAYAWIDNAKILRKLDLSGKAVHLLYLDEALKRYQDKKLVIEHFKNDSSKEFQNWAHSVETESRNELIEEVDVRLEKIGIMVGDDFALLWPTHYPETDRKWLGGLVVKAYEARNEGHLAHVVSVYDAGEARAVDNFLKKLRASK